MEIDKYLLILNNQGQEIIGIWNVFNFTKLILSGIAISLK